MCFLNSLVQVFSCFFSFYSDMNNSLVLTLSLVPDAKYTCFCLLTRLGFFSWRCCGPFACLCHQQNWLLLLSFCLSSIEFNSSGIAIASIHSFIPDISTAPLQVPYLSWHGPWCKDSIWASVSQSWAPRFYSAPRKPSTCRAPVIYGRCVKQMGCPKGSANEVQVQFPEDQRW